MISVAALYSYRRRQSFGPIFACGSNNHIDYDVKYNSFLNFNLIEINLVVQVRSHCHVTRHFRHKTYFI